MAKTIIVSNRLPVKIIKEDGDLYFRPSEGGLATGLGSIYKQGQNLWVGWPGLPVANKEEKKRVHEALSEENMVPVFLSKKMIVDFYEGVCNASIWPLFHYFLQYAEYDQKLFHAYVEANRKYLQVVLQVAEPTDTIWVHDYHLMLLPQMIREHLPKASIGFFLHIPFPSYEVFRIMPWRRDILRGILGADLVGFHTYDDTRHFLSSVNRLVGLPNTRGTIDNGSRIIEVDSFPMGIDYQKYALSAAAPKTLDQEIKYSAFLGDQKLILSIDRLDYSKGIPQRLLAFENFLEKYHEYEEKVSLIMIVVPSRDTVGRYRQLKEEVDLLVGKINGKHGRINWTPVHYFYRSFPLETLSALYRMSHVALVTPLRDGMNLVSKEFIASKLDKTGVLILSEMAGASKELSDAILINPNDTNRMVESIRQALVMPEEEQIMHISVMQETLKRYNIHHWVKMFTQRLHFIKDIQNSMGTKNLDSDVLKSIKKHYEQAQRRLLFLDYDGTLTGFQPEPGLAKPDRNLLNLLRKLAHDPKNRIIIISGRDKSTLNKWLAPLPIDVISEHGVWLKEKDAGWEMISNLENEWKEDIRPIMDLYVNRTPGSFIEEKDYSLVWHFRKVETGLGELRSRELLSHLNYLTADKNLQVLEGDMVVEVKSAEVNKGSAARKWLRKYPHDFVLSVGDDWTDEDMFKAMPRNAYTVKVGGTTSAAKYHVQNHEEVRSFLKKLSNHG